MLDLPTPGFVLLLALALRGATGDDGTARTWWQAVAVGAVADGAAAAGRVRRGADGLAPLAVAVAAATLVAAIVLCFLHASRPWVSDVVVADPAPSGG